MAARGQAGRERRTVTILFCDVKGSTALAEGLDPEDVTEIMEGAFQVLVAPVCRYEGTLARLMGDAILAFFGAPIAHEDDPERACRAGLEITTEARRYGERLGSERGIQGFDVRVGINTGLVVVGEVGSDLRVEYTAMGDAVNLAARMQSAADPGSVLITGNTHRLIAPLFETAALGSIQVHGRARPVDAYQLLGPKPAARKARGVPGLESALVGREAEMRSLQETLERLQAGAGGIVTLVGEAGLGKSRLVAELRQRPPAESVRWVEGRCLSYGTSAAYLLWLDALRGLLGVTAAEAPLAVRDALWAQVQALCAESADQVYPFLAKLLTLPLTPEQGASMQGLDGKDLRAGTFQAIEALLECSARKRPLVLVCEDLQWADPTSVELLEHLLRLTERAPVLLVCVFREEREHASWHLKEAAARDCPHRHTDVRLAPLSTSETRTLLGNLLPAPDVLGTLQERVLSHAEGNPFYVEEIIRSLIDSGSVVRDRASGTWRATQDLDEIPIPDTLDGVLTARIDRLPEESRRLLQTAAVIGRIFSRRLLAAVAHEESAGPGEFEAQLTTLQREQMIRERGRIPEVEYIFKHQLTQEAAYNGLLKARRRVLHRQVAETLERLHAERVEEQVEVLAHHWERAGDAAKATHYLIRAADRARELGASLEAIGFYEAVLQKTTALPSPRRADDLSRIHEGLGDVYLVNLSRLEEALDHYGSFLQLAERDEDAARAARKVATVHTLRGNLPEAQKHYEAALARLRALPPLAEVGRVHYAFSYLLILRSQLEEAAQHAAASLEIARQVKDVRGLGDAYRVMGIIANEKGDAEGACAFDERSLEQYRELGDLPRTAQICNNVGDSYRLLGRMELAQERLTEGLVMARRVGDTREEALLLQTTAELYLDQGRWEMAIEHLQQALAAAERSGVAGRVIEAHRILGSACDAVGRPGEGLQHLEQADVLVRDTGQVRYAPALQLNLAHARATLGEHAEAQRCIEAAVQAAGPEPSDAFLGLMQRCGGYLHGCRREWSDAVSHLTQSVEHLERAKLLAEVGKARLSLGAAYASRGAEGDRGRACEQLLAAQSVFRQIQASGYLAQVQERLDEVGCRASNTDSGMDPDALPQGNRDEPS